MSLNLGEEIVSVGGASYSEVDADGKILWCLEGDSMYDKRRPMSSRSQHDYPTLVIEAGNSQGLNGLQGKTRLLWFEKSLAHVKLSRLNENSNSTCIEKWIPRLATRRDS